VRRRRHVAIALAGLALCAWCGWVSGFHRGTVPAGTTWAASLAVVVAADLLFWQGRHGRRPGMRLDPMERSWPGPGRAGRAALGGASPWLVLALVVVSWEVLGIDTGQHQPHLTISALTQAFRPLNAAALLVWMLVGTGYGAVRARATLATASHSPDRPGTDGATRHASPVLAHVPATGPALLLPGSRAVGVGFWLGVVGAAVVIELLARRSQGRVPHAEELLAFLTDPPVANVIVVLAWTVAGYHLFAR
jgi:hypothetical protein